MNDPIGTAEASRNSDPIFRALLRATFDTLYAMGPDWKEMRWLEGKGILVDRQSTDMDWLQSYILPEDQPHVWAVIQEAIRSKGTFQLEHRVRQADGSIGWTLSRAIPTLDDAGQITQWVGAATDVTHRKQAGDQLRQSEQRYHALFAASPVPFMVLAPNPPDFTVTAANDAYLAATLTTREGLVGRRLFDIFTDDPSRPNPNGPDALNVSLDRVLKTRQTNAMQRTRYDIVKPGGGFEPRWWLAINAPVLDDNGEVTAIIHQVTNETELHYAEVAGRENQERQAFLLRLSDGLRSLDEPGKITAMATRLLSEWLGASRAYYVIWPSGEIYGEVAEDYAAPGLTSLAGRYPIDTFRSAYDRIAQGTTWIVQDAAADVEMAAAERQYYLNAGVMAWIDVPLLKRGQVRAAFCLVQDKSRRWTANEIAIVEETAERCWLAIERARAESALRKSEERQAFLLKLSDALHPIADATEIQAIASRHLGEYLHVLRAGYGEVEGDAVVIRADYTNSVASMTGRYPIDAFGPALAKAYREGGTTVVRNAETDPELTDAEREQFLALKVAAHVTVVIRKAGQSAISLGVQSDIHRDWRDDEIALIQDIAERTWAAVARSRAEQALREGEERFRLYVENVREYALVQTDLEGIVTSWNPGAERLFGYTSAEVIDHAFVMMLPTEDRHEGIIAREMAQLSVGKRVLDAHFVQRKNGSRFWAEWITEPVFDDAGKLRGTAKVMRDETERQHSESALRSSLAEKEELLKEVHHRVKNNLQVITSLLNLQAGSVEDPQTLSLFDEARNRVQSIAAIHEMLYRSASFSSIRLKDYAQDLLSSLVGFYGMTDRICSEVTGEDVLIELERAVPLGLLLNELVSNALKHAFPNGRTGEVGIAIERANNETTMRVTDTGVGLPLSFDYERSTSLGLKLVRILIRQLRGEIRIVRDTETTFHVSIPAED